MLSEEGIGKPKEWFVFNSGKLNSACGLDIDENVNFLAFPLDGLQVGKLAMFKIRNGDRWLDDFVANNLPENEEDCANDQMM